MRRRSRTSEPVRETSEALRRLIETSKELPAPKPPPPNRLRPPIPPPDAVEQARVLDAARDYARDYSKKLPNFICTQVTRRYEDPSGLEFWQSQDTVVEKLSFFEQKEEYKLLFVNNVRLRARGSVSEARLLAGNSARG